jgi:hypothetical protein
MREIPLCWLLRLSLTVKLVNAVNELAEDTTVLVLLLFPRRNRDVHVEPCVVLYFIYFLPTFNPRLA